MTDEEKRYDAINMLTYFWWDRGDVERWVGFDREYLSKEFPAMLKAWDDYKASLAVLNTIMRTLDD